MLSISNNEFINNTAAYGGAIYMSHTLLALNLTDNIFYGNSAYDGGAIYKLATGKQNFIELE